MEKYDDARMDADLDRLLKSATDPVVPNGAEARLMAAVRAQALPSNVVYLRPRRAFNHWAIGLPLAASLLLGIYLGTHDSIDSYLPDSVTGAAIAGATDADVSTGLDDVENYSDGETT